MINQLNPSEVYAEECTYNNGIGLLAIDDDLFGNF